MPGVLSSEPAKDRLPSELPFLEDRSVHQVLLQVQPFHRIGEALSMGSLWWNLAKVLAESMLFPCTLALGFHKLPQFGLRGEIFDMLWERQLKTGAKRLLSMDRQNW